MKHHPEHQPEDAAEKASVVQSVLGVGFFLGLVEVVDWGVRRYGLNLPAPVLAMALLTLGLAFQKRVPATLSAGAGLLFRLFPLFFIPPLVAIVAVMDVVVRSWAALLFAVSISTFVGLAVTALVFRGLRKAQAGRGEGTP
ncbi:CidA/LrgA family protein [Kordiimonas marina]|uniref:CidA/LrgA family protein n=1 Tax=Kordiimonas marina TaxID=2872312 RepID=UPI001FF671E6|nr:CidA/LrgA family protein [Kordiimonas marina]MCJ9429716.1 CidA/LrgA family protein [Kordiimonas marina]